MPAIGFLHLGSPEPVASNVAAFRQALKETGFVDGRNMAIEYRWARGQYDRQVWQRYELFRGTLSQRNLADFMNSKASTIPRTEEPARADLRALT